LPRAARYEEQEIKTKDQRENMNVLNPSLYEALSRAFSPIKVSDDGQHASVTHCPAWSKGGKLEVEVDGGEYYRVDCPFCTDLKQRLYVNHVWGMMDERTGRRLLFPIHCFNEGCLNSYSQQNRFWEMVYPMGRLNSKPKIKQPTNVSWRTGWTVPPAIKLPVDPMFPVHDAATSAAAQTYLKSRRFNPGDLWRRWRVLYCPSGENAQPRFNERIVAPIYSAPEIHQHSPKLAGWQARTIAGDLPKYLTAKGFKKSQMLYGLSAAMATTGPIVVVEGVTDVWRLKSNAVAMFGKTLSTGQQMLLRKHFSDRPIVFFLDDDAQDKMLEVQQTLRSELPEDATITVAKLPAGRPDVGDCTYKEAWGQVALSLECSIGDLGLSKDGWQSWRHPQVIGERFSD